jgi:trimeric autotransporter adhesin
MKTRRLYKKLLKKKKAVKMINLIDDTEDILEMRLKKKKLEENFKNSQSENSNSQITHSSLQENERNLNSYKLITQNGGSSESQTEKFLGLKRGLQSRRENSNSQDNSETNETNETEKIDKNKKKKKKFEKNKSISGRKKEYRDITEIILDSVSEERCYENENENGLNYNYSEESSGSGSASEGSQGSDRRSQRSGTSKSKSNFYENLKKRKTTQSNESIPRSKSVSVYSLSSGSVSSSSSNLEFSEEESSQEDSSFKYRIANKERKQSESVSSDSCSDISAFSRNKEQIVSNKKISSKANFKKRPKKSRTLSESIKSNRLSNSKSKSKSKSDKSKSKSSKSSDSNYMDKNNQRDQQENSSMNEDLVGDIKFDKVKRIISAKIVDPQNRELKCVVEFEQRPDGYTPGPKKYTTKVLKEYAPSSLIEFLISRICVNRNTFNS